MHDSPSIKQLKQFGCLIGFSFPILIGWLLPAIFGHGFHNWTLWVGIPGLILGLIAPESMRLPYRVGRALGHVLQSVGSYMVLGLAFVVVLQPIAYLMRVLGYDPLRRRNHHGIITYREVRKYLEVHFRRTL
jgi:hypothetical protein